jgi:hypothetical protein
MLLIYTDETGKDLKKGKNGTYRDGSFFIYGGLAFSETKLSVVEIAFKELCQEILGVRSPLITEIHTGDIFYRKKTFSHITEKQTKEFFREVFQLLIKFDLPFIAGLVFKDATIFQTELQKVASAIYSFFSALDYLLSSENENGIIIADELESGSPKIEELLKEKSLRGKKGGIKLSLLLKRILYEQSAKLKEFNVKPLIPLRYRFESKTYFIVDNIFYVNSHASILNQISDIVLFVLNVYFEITSLLIQKEQKQGNTTNFQRKASFLEYLIADFLSYLNNCSLLSFLTKTGNSYDYAPLKLQNFIIGNLKEKAQSLVRMILEMQTKGT